MTPLAALSPRECFARAVRVPESEIDLAEAALWIAAEASPELDVARYLGALDQLADAARPDVLACADERDAARTLLRLLCAEWGFAGNSAAYHDPRNSMLNEVIDRRVGIPITLSIVLIEVARRLDIALRGVGMPGHFIVRTAAEPPIFLDMFGGSVVSHSECELLMRRAQGDDAVLLPEHLRPARPREILARVLTNLKQIYIEADDLAAALACSDRILLLQPDAPLELRDRGLIYARLECFRAALADIERYVLLSGDPRVERAAHDVLAALRQRVAQLH